MNILIGFILSLVFWGNSGTTASETDITQTVGTSLRSGDASQLSARFARTIELVIDTENVEFQSLRAAHAEQILRSFFRKYPPRRFNFVYKGASDHLRYSTGTYVTHGQVFAVYVLMRQTNDHRYAINALHFRNGKKDE